MRLLPAFLNLILLLAAPPFPARAPGTVRHAARFRRPRELPGAGGTPASTGSITTPGTLPALFAVRRDGTLVREFRLAVPNIDWEDIAADDQGHLLRGRHRQQQRPAAGPGHLSHR